MQNLTKSELIAELEKSKQREEHYRILLDDSSDPIFSFDRNGQYLYVNSQFTQCVCDTLTPEEVIGKTLWDLFPKEEADKRFSIAEQVFESRAAMTIEVRAPSETKEVYHLTTVKPIFGEDGEVTHIICIAKDISEKKVQEAELKKRTLELERALQEVKDLQGIVPICSYCKNTRNDDGYWNSVEIYISKHTGAELSHGICPDCLPQAYKAAGIEPPAEKQLG